MGGTANFCISNGFHAHPCEVFGAEPTIGIMNPIAKKPSGPNSGAPPQMRVVQQSGPEMKIKNLRNVTTTVTFSEPNVIPEIVQGQELA